MKQRFVIGLILLLLLASCTTTTREARRMVRRAERLADTLPDSTLRLIDSVLRMEAYFTERERMEVAMLQGEVLFGDHGQEIPPLMDDEFFDDKPFFSISPELERAAEYYARKKQYDRAATAALYSGFVQQHYGEKQIAMQSFKEAELYGDMAGDSLAVAMAQSRMGKLLYGENLYDEALAMFQSASNKLGNLHSGKALVLNMTAVCHLMLNDLESAEVCLKQSLLLAEQGHINKVKWKVLNNYAVFYRLQGKYEEAIGCLRQMKESIHSDNELFMFYLNMSHAYMAANELDSVAKYAKRMEGLMPTTDVRDESKVSAYEMLTNLAKMSGNESLALQYRETHERYLYEVMRQSQEKNVYRIQRQYDHEILQGKMVRQIIHWHRMVFIIGIFAILGLTALVFSQIRLNKARKQQAETKANLLKFSYQNEELMQRHDEYKRTHAEMIQKVSEKEKMYQQLLREHEEKFIDAKHQEAEAKANLSSFMALHEDNKKIIRDLVQKNSEMEKMTEECIKSLSAALRKEGHTMLRLDLFMNNQGEKSYLKDLNKIVFDDYEHWMAIMKLFDTLYPGVMQNLMDKHPKLTQLEQKDVVCSFFDVSRHDESVLLGISIHKVDRLRNSVRKKLHEKGN